MFDFMVLLTKYQYMNINTILVIKTYRFAMKTGRTHCVCDVAGRWHRAPLYSSGLQHMNTHIHSKCLLINEMSF